MLIMREMHIDQVDLNLLPSLIALVEERHVSRAAARAGLSQPAMSRALQRLRRALGDELLVRSGGGYRLTPRGERVRGQLTAIIPQLDGLFSAEVFTPGTAAESFRVAGTDYVIQTFGSPLFRRFFGESPGSTLSFETWHDGVFRDVESGTVDLVFFGATGPASLRSEYLFDDDYVCVLDEAHPLAGRDEISLAEYLSCTHLVVGVENGRQPSIDQRLAAVGTPRVAGLTVPYHAVAANAVVGTRLVATLPSRMVGDIPGRRAPAAPAEIRTMSYSMSWHPRLDGDPAHTWLRDLVRAAVRR
jgi:DNA-binding transcriptional LysR family regulator